MKSIQKTVLFAGAIVGLSVAAYAQDNEPKTQNVTSANGHFDLSPNACYNRMKEVDSIRHEKFGVTEDTWSALVNHGADDILFGVPLSAWDDALVNEFYNGVEACMEPQGMKTEFGTALPDTLRAHFPDYLERLRQQADRALRFKEGSASSSGTAASCLELVKYAEKKAHPDRSGFGDAPFGKRVATYEDTDFRFLSDKIDTCVRLMKDAGTDNRDLSEEITHLLALQKEISTKWREDQRNQAPAEQAIAQIQAEQAVAASEHERRKTAPTILERIGDYMAKVGFIGLLIGVAMSGKKDRRFKNGHKPDLLPAKPMRIVAISSLALIVVGWLIG